MNSCYNVFCDESCHLENDGISAMVLGAVWCPDAISRRIGRDIRAIKKQHGLKSDFEIKWTKVSASKINFYSDIVDYFFDHPALHFRGVVVPDKTKLQHQKFNQNHNDFYYKMFFYTLRNILEAENAYCVYLDIKDTLGPDKIHKLKEVLQNENYDFDRTMIKRIQHVRSHEMEQLQLTDLFIGALGYVHRALDTNKGKLDLINRIKSRSGKSLIQSTLPTERKFDVFVWRAQ